MKAIAEAIAVIWRNIWHGPRDIKGSTAGRRIGHPKPNDSGRKSSSKGAAKNAPAKRRARPATKAKRAVGRFAKRQTKKAVWKAAKATRQALDNNRSQSPAKSPGRAAARTRLVPGPGPRRGPVEYRIQVRPDGTTGTYTFDLSGMKPSPRTGTRPSTKRSPRPGTSPGTGTSPRTETTMTTSPDAGPTQFGTAETVPDALTKFTDLDGYLGRLAEMDLESVSSQVTALGDAGVGGQLGPEISGGAREVAADLQTAAAALSRAKERMAMVTARATEQWNAPSEALAGVEADGDLTLTQMRPQ